eukprot:GHRQ01027927.1.p1 GENE.GHRQ01027927.1~~GHRQ01027927.1.p1  ORF type:complete len:107 (+),score=21.46 GHRQ01027927.1:827-1147(+)
MGPTTDATQRQLLLLRAPNTCCSSCSAGALSLGGPTSTCCTCSSYSKEYTTPCWYAVCLGSSCAGRDHSAGGQEKAAGLNGQKADRSRTSSSSMGEVHNAERRAQA